MKKACSQSRRSFLKTSVASAAGIAIAGGLSRTAIAKETGWTNGMRINPLIDNLKVVSCKDTTYLSKVPTSFGFSTVNSAVNSARVAANMDEMAKSLTEATTASAAWAIIFQQPAMSATNTAKKPWAQVKAAFKVNAVMNTLMPKIAIVNKIALELNNLGVPYASMIVYDAGANASGNYNYTNSPLTAGIKVSNLNSLLNGTVSAPVPAPFNQNVNCTADIANGVIDILINFAVNKGHDALYGNCTLGLKNHLGTFDPTVLHGNYNAFIGANKSDAILGGTVCRQQLVIVDSIMAAIPGPSSGPDTSSKWPYRIIMGTFAPAVDYITQKKVREAAPMSAPASTTVNDLPIQFGYTAAQRDAMVLTDVPPAPVTGISFEEQPGQDLRREIRIEVSGNSRNGMARISFSSDEVTQVSIYDIRGRQIREFTPMGRDGRAIFWDAKTDMGLTVNSGTYVVSLRGAKTERSVKIAVR